MAKEPFWPLKQATRSLEAAPSPDAWSPRRRLKGSSNAGSNTTLVGRAFSRWSNNEETLVDEVPKWQAEQKWRKLAKWKWMYDGTE